MLGLPWPRGASTYPLLVHNASTRPRLRPVESIVVPDPEHGRLLVLRDTQGITDAHASVPPALVAIIARFDGSRTCEQIAGEAARELGEAVPVELVAKLANELDRALFLEGKRFDDALGKIARDFADSPVRAASHAEAPTTATPPRCARTSTPSAWTRRPRRPSAPSAGTRAKAPSSVSSRRTSTRGAERSGTGMRTGR